MSNNKDLQADLKKQQEFVENLEEANLKKNQEIVKLTKEKQLQQKELQLNEQRIERQIREKEQLLDQIKAFQARELHSKNIIQNLEEQLRIARQRNDTARVRQLQAELQQAQAELNENRIWMKAYEKDKIRMIKKEGFITDLWDDNEELKKQIEQLEGEVLDLKVDLKETRAKLGEKQVLAEENRELQRKLTNLRETLDRTNKQLEKTLLKKNTAEKERLDLDQKLVQEIAENVHLQEAIQDLEVELVGTRMSRDYFKQELEIADEQLRKLEVRVKNQNELIDFTDEEKREFRAIKEMSIFTSNTPVDTIIQAGEIEAEEWRDRAKKYGIGTVKGKLCIEAAYRLEFQLDYFRNLKGEIPVTMEARKMLQNTIDNSELGRYTRFKRWAKENALGLAAFAITTAGLITTLAIGLKKGAVTAGKAVWHVSKSLAKFASIAGPIAGSVLGIFATILNWGSKAIFFLAHNLWILAVMVLGWLYEQNRRRRKIKST